MPITESDLPGVGKEEVRDQDDGEMVVVIHNTGKREVFRRPNPDADSEKVFEFSDDLARTIGSIIEGRTSSRSSRPPRRRRCRAESSLSGTSFTPAPRSSVRRWKAPTSGTERGSQSSRSSATTR